MMLVLFENLVFAFRFCLFFFVFLISKIYDLVQELDFIYILTPKFEK
jgi:hypothetical protein